MNDIADRTMEVISQVSCHEVKSADTLKSLDLDSLDLVELEMLLEEEFGIEIETDTSEGWHTVQDVINHVERVTCLN